MRIEKETEHGKGLEPGQ